MDLGRGKVFFFFFLGKRDSRSLTALPECGVVAVDGGRRAEDRI